MTDSAPNQTGSAAAQNGGPPALDQAFDEDFPVPSHRCPHIGSLSGQFFRQCFERCFHHSRIPKFNHPFMLQLPQTSDCSRTSERG